MLFLTAHHVQRAGADRRDHVHGRGDREQHPGGQLREGASWRAGSGAVDAALDAGFTRFRPVLMTALAMIIGMVPMALGLGEGGEQNAPLGRAVIGGLVLATVATLFFVPVGVRAAARPAGRRRRRPHCRNECRTVAIGIRSVAVVGGCLLLAVGRRRSPSGASRRAPRARRRDPAKPASWRSRPSSVIAPERGAPQQEIVLPGTMQAFADARDLRAHQRLPAQVVRRPRRAGPRRPAAGRHRYAGDRSAAGAGARRSGHRRSQRPARAVHRRTLSRSDQDRFGVEAGSRQRQRQPRGAATAVDSARANVKRLEQLKAFSRIDRAVRRRRHGTQHRRRRADRLGQQRQGAVSRRRGAPAARVRQRPARSTREQRGRA